MTADARAANPGWPFVGRGHEIATLERAWRDVIAGGRALISVRGEPGAGKTSLIRELLARVDDGTRFTLFGSCEAGWRKPFAPFDLAIGAHIDGHGLAEPTHRFAPWLARVSARIEAALGFPTGPTTRDEEDAHARMLVAVSRWIAAMARPNGGLVVIDDVQWIDAESGALLRRLCADGTTGLMIIVVHRDGEVVPGGAGDAVLEEVARHDPIRIELAGLDEADVASLATAIGRPDMASRVHARSDGNPLFARVLLESPDDDEHPHTVRDLIDVRVASLSDSCRELVRAASVVGPSFSGRTIAAVLGQSDAALLDSLEEAMRARLLVEQSADEWRFAHEVVWSAVRDTVSHARRMRLHARIAHALETDDATDPAQIAEHYVLSGTPDGRRAAVEHLRRAAALAERSFAYDTAIARYRSAEELVDPDDVESAPVRMDLALRRGVAERGAGSADWSNTLRAVAREAMAIGDCETLVRATLANSRGYHTRLGTIDEEVVGLLEAALECVAPDDPRRAALLVTLGNELNFSADRSIPEALCFEAVAAARAGGDPAVLAHVLRMASGPITAPWTVEYRLEMAVELETLANSLGDTRALVQALFSQVHGYLETARFDDLEVAYDKLQHLTDLHDPWLVRTQQQARFVVTAARGDLAQAESIANANLEHGAAMGMVDAFTIYAAELFFVRYLQGRLHELVELAERAADDNPAIAGLTAAHAVALVEAGDLERAARLVRAVTPALESIPRDLNWVTALCTWAEAIARVGDTEAATIVARLLAPYAHLVGVSSPVVWGSMHRSVGLLEAVLGHDDTAAEHLQQAIDVNHAGGLRGWEAMARHEHAVVRRALGEDVDEEPIRVLAVELGMDGLRRAIDRARATEN